MCKPPLQTLNYQLLTNTHRWSLPCSVVRTICRYPLDPTVTLTVTPIGQSEMELRLRIPSWSERTTVKINGVALPSPVVAGTYLRVRRLWAAGDVVTLVFDFRLRAWAMGAAVASISTWPIPTLPADDMASSMATTQTTNTLVHSPARRPVLASAPPVPVWDSTRDGKWPATGKVFTGDASEMMVIDGDAPPLENRPCVEPPFVSFFQITPQLHKQERATESTIDPLFFLSLSFFFLSFFPI